MTHTVVVGSAGGIGEQVCARLEAAGHALVRIDRVTGTDAADPDSVRDALAGVDVLDHYVHLAGTAGAGGLEDQTLERWHQILDDNLTTTFVCAQQVVPLLRDGTGSLVLSGSVTARTGGNRHSGPAYAASKGAIAALTRHLALDLAPRGVRANAIAAGPVDTPMLRRLDQGAIDDLLDHIPLRRITPPEEIAAAVAFLLGAESGSITGTVLDVNGGMWMG